MESWVKNTAFYCLVPTYHHLLSIINKKSPESLYYCDSGLVYNWCRRRDSNSHDRGPLPPQDSVSTNSTTSAPDFFISAATLLLEPPQEQLPVLEFVQPVREWLSELYLLQARARLPAEPADHS